MPWGPNTGTGHLPPGSTSNQLGCPVQVPGQLIILTSARNTGEQVEPSPPDSLRIPQLAVWFQQCVRAIPIPEHIQPLHSSWVFGSRSPLQTSWSDSTPPLPLVQTFSLTALPFNFFLPFPIPFSYKVHWKQLLAYKPPFRGILFNWLMDYPTFKTHLPSLNLSLIINKFQQGMRSLLYPQLSQSMPEILPVYEE